MVSLVNAERRTPSRPITHTGASRHWLLAGVQVLVPPDRPGIARFWPCFARRYHTGPGQTIQSASPKRDLPVAGRIRRGGAGRRAPAGHRRANRRRRLHGPQPCCWSKATVSSAAWGRARRGRHQLLPAARQRARRKSVRVVHGVARRALFILSPPPSIRLGGLNAPHVVFGKDRRRKPM